MHQFEIRTRATNEVVEVIEPNTEGAALSVFNGRYKADGDCVLVVHEWETAEEADRARLDFFQSHPLDVYASLNRDGNIEWLIPRKSTIVLGDIRGAIDVARNAPQETVRVIAGGDI